MSRLARILILSVAASVLAWLWYTAWPELFRNGMPSITEDADFALLVRLTGSCRHPRHRLLFCG